MISFLPWLPRTKVIFGNCSPFFPPSFPLFYPPTNNKVYLLSHGRKAQWAAPAAAFFTSLPAVLPLRPRGLRGSSASPSSKLSNKCQPSIHPNPARLHVFSRFTFPSPPGYLLLLCIHYKKWSGPSFFPLLRNTRN